AITTAAVQDWILVREASKFARTYEGVLDKGSFDEAVWYGQNPLIRTGKSPVDLLTELKKSRTGAGMVEREQASPIRLTKLVSEGSADIHFSEIEQHGKEGLNVFAAALFEVQPAAGKTLSEDEHYALILLKGMKRNRRYEWWVERVGFPYKPD